MKKYVLSTLVAGCFATSALAQVSVYGVLDQALRTTKLDGGTSTSSMVSGSYATSRIGIKGSEDLGGGMSTSFVLEGAVNGNTGSTGTGDNLFDREASVSLTTRAGTFTLGRTDTSNSEGVDTFVGNFGNFAFVSGVEYSGNRENTAKYTSPTLGGFTAQIGRSLKTDTAAETDSVSATFEQGSIGLAVGYDKTGDDTYTAIGGKIDAGIVSLGAMYGVRDALVKTDVVVVSAKAPLNQTFSAHGAYKTSETEGSDKVTTLVAGLSMNLSKRTSVIGVYQDTNRGNAAGYLYQVGLVHSF